MLIIFPCFGSVRLQIQLSLSIQNYTLLGIFQWNNFAEEKEFSNWQCSTKPHNCTGKGDCSGYWRTRYIFHAAFSKCSNSTFAHLGWYLNQLDLLEQFYYWNRDFSLNLSDYKRAYIIYNASLLWAPHSSNILSPLLWVFVFLQRQPRTEVMFFCPQWVLWCIWCTLSHVPQPAGLALLLLTQGPSINFCWGKRQKKFRKIFISSLCQIRPFECFWWSEDFGRMRLFLTALNSFNHCFPCCSYDELQTIAWLAAQYLFKSLLVSSMSLIFYLCCIKFRISLHANSSCQQQCLTE